MQIASKAFQHKHSVVLLTAAFLMMADTAQTAAQTITEINPSQSTLWATDPDGASGGRVNHVGVAPKDKNIIFAASEWGGIYKSTDKGQTWTRMNGHHPTVTWDVKVSPADSKIVVATSFYDGKVNSGAGINVSFDGGATWTHPPTATPPAGFCTSTTRHDEPSAYGIAFDPAKPQDVYVGTNCGLAISNNGGSTWHYVDPTPGDPADDVWAVTVHHGSTIDTCGDDGHRRSTNGGTSFTSTTGNGTPLNAGICSIAASPDEKDVLFAVAGTTIFESDNGGGTWTAGAYGNRAPQGRIPFVKTNSRGKNKYDLWFGDVSVFRGSCTTPSPAAPGNRCVSSASWAGPFTRSSGAHDDMGDIAFDPSPGTKPDNSCQEACDAERDQCMKDVAKPGGPRPQECVQELKICLKECKPLPPIKLDACPMIMSSDGGVFVNASGTSPSCQTPQWNQPKVTPHGLWAFGMNSVHGSGTSENLYFGNQDDGTFATANAQTNSPTWNNRDCCDAFDVAVDTNQVLYTVCCCPSCAHSNRVFLRSAGMTGGGEINTYPAGSVPGFRTPDVMDRFAANSYVLLTSSGVFITTNITATPSIAWSQLGARPANACAVKASVSGSTPSFFVQAGSCSGSGADQLWRYNGTGTGGTWNQINPPAGFSGFGVFSVDKKNPDRLVASVLGPGTVQMVLSTNGGANWSNLTTLDTAMTGGSTFKYRNALGPTNFTGFNGYAQPTLVAFATYDTKTLVAAGADSGVFLSKDTGATWTKVTDNSGTASNPHVPRAGIASFDRGGGVFTIFLATQGRGVWRINYPDTVGACQLDCQNANNTCTDGCDADRDRCMQDVAHPGGPRPQECVAELRACLGECTTDLNKCKQRCQ